MSFVAAPDFETKSEYQATLTVSDGSFTSSTALSVTINDLNDNVPEFTTSLTFSTPEEETSNRNCSSNRCGRKYSNYLQH